MKVLYAFNNEWCYEVMALDEENEQYIYGLVFPDDSEPPKVDAKYPLSEYKDRDHFAGVIGKFMPHVWILDEAHEIPVQALTWDEMQRAAEIIKERNKRP